MFFWSTSNDFPEVFGENHKYYVSSPLVIVTLSRLEKWTVVSGQKVLQSSLVLTSLTEDIFVCLLDMKMGF